MPTAVNAHEFGASIYATPNGHHAVSSARDGFRIWDVAKREIIRGRAQDDAFRMAALSADGGQLIFFDASVEQPREPSRPRDMGMMGLCDLPSGEIEWGITGVHPHGSGDYRHGVNNGVQGRV